MLFLETVTSSATQASVPGVMQSSFDRLSDDDRYQKVIDKPGTPLRVISGGKSSSAAKRGPARLDKMVVSIICYLYFLITGSIGIVISVILRLCTCAIDEEGRYLHNLVGPWALHYMQLPPLWKLKVEGREKLKKDAAYVIVSNHQSSLDPFFLYSLPTVFKWTSKDWVFNVPVVGWVLSLHAHIKINPGRPEAFLQECKYWLNERKISVIVFPEGTRSDDGELLRFKYGAFHLSVVDDVPILPVVLIGSRDILPKGTWVLNYKANVRLKILDPVYPADFNYDENLIRQYVREQMQFELKKLRAGPAPSAAKTACR